MAESDPHVPRPANGAQPSPIVDMGEFEPYAGRWRITAAELADGTVAVTWDDGARARFHPIWLRDNCACAACRHPQTRERTVKLADLVDSGGDPGTPALAATPAGALQCRWPDGHESLFDPGWLRRHRPHGDRGPGDRVRPWTAADMAAGPVRVPYAAVLDTADGLRSWLQALLRDGVALADGGPTDQGALMRLVERIGWARETNFGHTFDVVSKPNPNNAAYTAIALEPHVDLPNWRRPPDVQLLYCLENGAEGGESLLIDGFAAARALAERQPGAYEVLCTQPVDFRFQDETSDIRHRAPTIGRDADGNLTEIRFNNWIRDAQAMDPQAAGRFYDAYLRFWALLRDPAFTIRFQLQPGELMGFDNLRVLHGRAAFDPNSGRRHLRGAYLDRDLVESRLRVLERAT